MLNLLCLFTGGWKKSDAAAPAPAQPAAPDRPALPHRTPTALEERQRLLGHHVRLVARGMANGLCVYGSRGGLGKTRVVLATLKEEGVAPVIMTGHCTPLAMYMALYEHPDSVVFLDDCDAMFRNLPALGILRSALWEGEKGNRLVNYNSSPVEDPLVVPLHRQGHLRHQHPSHDEPRIRCRAEPGRPVRVVCQQRRSPRHDAATGGAGIRGTDRRTNAMRSWTSSREFSATRELSLAAAGAELPEGDLRQGGRRGLAATRRQPAPRDRANCGSQASDSRAYDLECLRQVLQDYPDDAAEQEAAFRALTHRSRATFFRLKRALSNTGMVQAAMGVG